MANGQQPPPVWKTLQAFARQRAKGKKKPRTTKGKGKPPGGGSL